MKEREAPPPLKGICMKKMMKARLSEPCEEKGVSDELLEMWEGNESRIFTLGTARESSEDINPLVRNTVLSFGRQITEKTKTPNNCYVQMIQLFDAAIPHMVKLNMHTDPRVVFTWAAAAWLLSTKISGETVHNPVQAIPLPDLAMIVSVFSRTLMGEDLEASDIEKAEVEMLFLFNFSCHTTPITSWIDAYLKRLEVLGMIAGTQTDCALNLCTMWSMSLLYAGPVRAIYPPRMLARGITGLALIALQILPAEGLCVNEASAADLRAKAEQYLSITKARLSTNPAGDAMAKLLADMPLKSVPPKAVEAGIQFATQSEFFDIQDQMLVVASMLRPLMWS